MSEWFQTKVKFLQQKDNGLIQKVSEQYLVDAMSFTEAESRILQEVGEGSKELTMMSVTRSNIKEVVFYGDTDKWFKAKVTYVLIDDESEKERRVTTYILVNANDVKEAYERTQEHLKEMMVPFDIPKVEESPIVEIFQYQKGLRPGLRKIREEDLPETADDVPGGMPKIKPRDVSYGGDFEVPEDEAGEESTEEE